ncbi:MAG: hypothetical protein KC910_11735 [Candidatus Eremiobacteraeota bacterium]|nr:hypothetical protein [Candidatus Eremiobacteraeota bacterium]
MAEVVVALGVFGFMFVSLAALFANLLGGSTKSANLTVGRAYASERLEAAIAGNAYWPVPADASAGLYSVDEEHKTTFFHRITTTKIPASASPTYTGAYYIEVEVWWWSSAPGQSRGNQGKLSTKVGRLHYPDGKVVSP